MHGQLPATRNSEVLTGSSKSTMHVSNLSHCTRKLKFDKALGWFGNREVSMPLVAHTNLPTFDRLRERGQVVLSLDRAVSQDIRELHIGLLNMMPDAATLL